MASKETLKKSQEARAAEPPAGNVRKAERTSPDLKAEQIKKLKQCFPEAVADGKINLDKLKAVLGEEVESSVEKFSFTWAGKSGAIKNVLIPSKATLRPDKKESVNFDQTENIFIEGDNLEVLKLLQKSYFESIKMIYIDPPYNTGNDFVYHDDFKNSIKNYLEQTGQVDSEGNKLQTNTESSGRFHSDWLNMMYPRLKLAWNLLMDKGVIFVSVDDHEMHNLKMLMNEIFGEENFLAHFIWHRRQNADSRNESGASTDHEYVLSYKKSDFRLRGTDIDITKYSNPDNDPRGPWFSADLTGLATKDRRPNLHYDVTNPKTGEIFHPSTTRGWGCSKNTFDQYIRENLILWPKKPGGRPRFKKFLKDVRSQQTGFSSMLEVGFTTEGTQQVQELFGGKILQFPKPLSLIKTLITQSTNGEDIVLDFFAGSCTTAEAVMTVNAEDGGNRKFIVVQLPEPTDKNSDAFKAGYKGIAEIGKERMRRAIKAPSHKNKGELELHPKSSDTLGFKVFKLDKSNYPDNQFEYDPGKSEEENERALREYLKKSGQADLFASAKGLDIIYENILKEGMSLNSKITETKIGKNTIHHVRDAKSKLFLCLDSKIDDATVERLTEPDFKEKVFICFDAAVDDSAKANLGLHLSLKTI